jgi:hypothetical protein
MTNDKISQMAATLEATPEECLYSKRLFTMIAKCYKECVY